MILTCPKCQAPVKHGRCTVCNDHVYENECVACGVRYCSVVDGKGPGPLHSHVCNPRTLANRDRALETEQRAPRTPTEIERYLEGVQMLNETAEEQDD